MKERRYDEGRRREIVPNRNISNLEDVFRVKEGPDRLFLGIQGRSLRPFSSRVCLRPRVRSENPVGPERGRGTIYDNGGLGGPGPDDRLRVHPLIPHK